MKILINNFQYRAQDLTNTVLKNNSGLNMSYTDSYNRIAA